MPVDPVCGMALAQDHAAVCSNYRGKHYCFCSEECKEEFDTDPEVYVGETVEAAYEEEEAT